MMGFAALGAFYSAAAHDSKKAESHMVTVKEVIQTTNYTYLHVHDGALLRWLAVPLMEAREGQTYYYSKPMVMTDFESPELKRKFDTVFFLGAVSPIPIGSEPAHQAVAAVDDKNYKRTAKPEARMDIKLEKAADGVTVAELLANKEKYAGKTVKIRAQVTKYNPQIMDKNWIHVQDGTQQAGKFDLMVTSQNEVKVGDNVLLEGQISLNKDFGYGYTFEIMMENAVVKH